MRAAATVVGPRQTGFLATDWTVQPRTERREKTSRLRWPRAEPPGGQGGSGSDNRHGAVSVGRNERKGGSGRRVDRLLRGSAAPVAQKALGADH